MLERAGLVLRAAAPDIYAMSLPPKITPEERRRRTADQLRIIRLRMAMGREPDHRGISAPAEIGAAFGMPPVDATKLMTRKQWREGDVAMLEAAATRLEVQVPERTSHNWLS